MHSIRWPKQCKPGPYLEILKHRCAKAVGPLLRGRRCFEVDVVLPWYSGTFWSQVFFLHPFECIWCQYVRATLLDAVAMAHFVPHILTVVGCTWVWNCMEWNLEPNRFWTTMVERITHFCLVNAVMYKVMLCHLWLARAICAETAFHKRVSTSCSGHVAHAAVFGQSVAV